MFCLRVANLVFVLSQKDFATRCSVVIVVGGVAY